MWNVLREIRKFTPKAEVNRMLGAPVFQLEDRPACEIYPCCSDSFEQFLEMAEKYLSIYREGKAEELEMREREFHSSIQKIDTGALAGEHALQNACAEKMDYGF